MRGDVIACHRNPAATVDNGMHMELLASQIASATGGVLVGPDVVVSGASHDSRALTPGALFVPIVAARDGHDFIADSLAAGAAAYLAGRCRREPTTGTAIVVDDTLAALTRLAHVVRGALPERVVGITGSVGKTTTKDLASAVLSTTYRTHANDRSFNNEIGVPLTILNAPHDTAALVVEMGARGVGHIEELCAIARPTIGLVTRVGAAHLELFGSIDEVAIAKSELVASLPPNGVAVLNADDERVSAMAAVTRALVLTYGAAGEVRASRVAVADDLTSRFALESPWGRADVALAVSGRHNVDNALAAAAVGLAAGVSIDAVAAGLSAARVSQWRMEMRRAPSGARIINDAYNANPVSMRAALEALVDLPAARRVAVLGPMAELGAESDAEHRAMGELARSLGVHVIAVAAPGYGGDDAADIDEAVRQLGELAPDDAVLVKGSRVAGLERLVDRLTER
jgi:UDP-N-acetylmuramoyl-tripeptide--D-alanyl-D-alanine ligase